MSSALAGCVVGGGACLAACYAFVLERYGESLDCVPLRSCARAAAPVRSDAPQRTAAYPAAPQFTVTMKSCEREGQTLRPSPIRDESHPDLILARHGRRSIFSRGVSEGALYLQLVAELRPGLQDTVATRAGNERACREPDRVPLALVSERGQGSDSRDPVA